MKLNKKSFFSAILQLSLLACGGSSLVLAAFFLYLSPSLPSVESVRDVPLQTPLRIYSADHKLIGEFGEKRRHPIELRNIPQPMIDALLAAEDADFYEHHGVSIKGILRAVKQLLETGRKGSGGSTLTMQLTRHIFLSLDKKFSRKFNEIILAMKLERELTKDEILELYMNYMFLGSRAYGVQAAAEVYYGKNVDELSTAQMAMIAACFQLPSSKNPISNPPWATERRDWILGRMLELGKIDQTTYQSAVQEIDGAYYHGSQFDVYAPYVAELAREKSIRSFGLAAYEDGYRVYTTIDSRLQAEAQTALVEGLLEYDKRHGYRGPEQKLDTGDIHVIDEETGEFDYTKWTDALANIPEYGGLQAAVITDIHDLGIKLITADAQAVELDWDEHLSQWRPYLNENARGPKASSPFELFELGDVVRLREPLPGMIELAQVPEAQGAIVALDPNDGSIHSLVGGFDFNLSNFNRVTQAKRQPGSNFKPFIYASALERGMTAATLINDAPIVFEDELLEGTWRPVNDTKKFYGPTRLREALYRSRNVVTIRLLREIGIGSAIETLSRFGFDKDALPRDLSLSLGTHSVTPLELATAWATFANGGYRVESHLIGRVEDGDGRVIYQAMPLTVCEECELSATTDELKDTLETEDAEPVDPDFMQPENLFRIPLEIKTELGILEAADYPRAQRVVEEDVVYIVDSILKDVIRRGTGVKARSLRRTDIAGKTGTTNGPIDVWFSGYNPDIMTTAWVGFDKNTPLGNNEYGGTAALPIWMDYMRAALQGKPEKHRPQPPNIVTVRINPDTGKRAAVDDPDADFEFFRRDNVPEELPQADSQVVKPVEIFSEEIF
jgi:penicillin-binding protein 1A